MTHYCQQLRVMKGSYSNLCIILLYDLDNCLILIEVYLILFWAQIVETIWMYVDENSS